MSSMKTIVIGAILLGLFTFGLINIIYTSVTDNNPNSTILTDSVLNSTFKSMNETLINQQGLADFQYKNGTLKDSPDASFQGIVLKSVVGATNLFNGFFINIYTIITSMAINNLGIPSILLNVIFTIMIIAIIFLGWKLYRQGS